MGIGEIHPRARGWANPWEGNQPTSLSHGGLDADDWKSVRDSLLPKDGPAPIDVAVGAEQWVQVQCGAQV